MEREIPFEAQAETVKSMIRDFSQLVDLLLGFDTDPGEEEWAVKYVLFELWDDSFSFHLVKGRQRVPWLTNCIQ